MMQLDFIKGLPVNTDTLSRLELEAIRAECQQLVRRASWVSAGGAVIPVPLLDIAIDVGVLMKIIPEINQRFQLMPENIAEMSEASRTKVWLRRAERGSELIGMVVTRQLIRKSIETAGVRVLTKQVTKFVPIAGQIVAATLGYWVMRKLAYRHIDDCFEVALAARHLKA